MIMRGMQDPTHDVRYKTVQGERRKGRSLLRFIDTVTRDMRANGIEENDVHVRVEWRRAIQHATFENMSC